MSKTSDTAQGSRAAVLLQQLRTSIKQGQDPLSATNDQSQQSSPPVTSDSQVSNQDKLDLFESVLSDVENMQSDQAVAQAMPAIHDQLDADLNPAAPSRGGVERQSSSNSDEINLEVGGIQSVEYERTPEIPPEVEEYLQRVEDHTDTLPQEIVIADGHSEPTSTHVPTQPVIVLPITSEEEREARMKGTTFSIKWLVTWSKKIAHMFKGKVIYKLID